ncbi:MAG TPA: hypothetical protein VGR51_09545 [Thermoplasmata archaeon]|jgi:predicted regulator of Ras-like GTPase activity (Roadblock/LC7/MglB family)|nr:hypothetical protein [Thermoplasmata archaeon]
MAMKPGAALLASRSAADITTSFEVIFDRAMRAQNEIEYIVIASQQGLVIASKCRVRGKENRFAAMSPVLDDAGETMFNELNLAPLAEVLLLGPEGTAYQVRLKSAPAFLLIAAKGQANVGLLRMIASRIETEASQLLQTFVQ